MANSSSMLPMVFVVVSTLLFLYLYGGTRVQNILLDIMKVFLCSSYNDYYLKIRSEEIPNGR